MSQLGLSYVIELSSAPGVPQDRVLYHTIVTRRHHDHADRVKEDPAEQRNIISSITQTGGDKEPRRKLLPQHRGREI